MLILFSIESRNESQTALSSMRIIDKKRIASINLLRVVKVRPQNRELMTV